jgi:hypothetical protein
LSSLLYPNQVKAESKVNIIALKTQKLTINSLELLNIGILTTNGTSQITIPVAMIFLRLDWIEVEILRESLLGFIVNFDLTCYDLILRFLVGFVNYILGCELSRTILV